MACAGNRIQVRPELDPGGCCFDFLARNVQSASRTQIWRGKIRSSSIVGLPSSMASIDVRAGLDIIPLAGMATAKSVTAPPSRVALPRLFNWIKYEL